MIGKLRIVEKEKESLEGKKLEAEAYMTKQAECYKQRIMGNKIIAHQAQVGTGKSVVLLLHCCTEVMAWPAWAHQVHGAI